MLRFLLLGLIGVTSVRANPILAHHAWYLHAEKVVARIGKESTAFECTFVLGTDRKAKMHWEDQPAFFSLPIWIPKGPESTLISFKSWFDVFQEKGVLVWLDRTEGGRDTAEALLGLTCARQHSPKDLDTFSYWREEELPASQRIDGADMITFRFGFDPAVARDQSALQFRYRQPHFRREGKVYFGYVPVFRGSEDEQPLAEPARYVIRLEPEAGVTLKLVAGRHYRAAEHGSMVVLAVPNTPILVEVQ